MVSQRLFGGTRAKGEYILFLDDDLEFSADFVELMIKPILAGQCDVTAFADLSLLPPVSGIKRFIPMLSLSACPRRKADGFYVKILKSGGWSYYRCKRNAPQYLYTESAPGMCCLCKKEDFLAIHLEEDLWLQDEKYALWDDQVLFYKFCLAGRQIMCLNAPVCVHLDAGGKTADRAIYAAHANSRNKYIFWNKYILKKQKTLIGRVTARVMNKYSRVMSWAFMCIGAVLSQERRKKFLAYRQGVIDGKSYIKRMDLLTDCEVSNEKKRVLFYRNPDARNSGRKV